MQLNAEDGGNRKFIMVQYPEATDENSEAFKAGYKNICEIGKERIRRAGEKILAELQEKKRRFSDMNDFSNMDDKSVVSIGHTKIAGNERADFYHENNEVTYISPQNNKQKYIFNSENLDVGFKVFKVADTNIKWNIVETMGQLSTADMTHTPDLVDFVEDFKDIDVVYEIMLRQKDVPLSETMEILSDIGERTYLYASSYLVCLETEITEQLIEKLASLAPLPIKFVFRDSAFKDDIDLKDYSFRNLKALVERNSGEKKQTYTVEFI